MNIETRQNLAGHLNTLKESFNAINKIWTEHDEYGDFIMDGMNSEYPFSECFNELSSDVALWVEESIVVINKLKV